MQVNWETEIDTPATIAIIGTGPMGLEAALYARFLGYFVLVFDEGKLAGDFLKYRDTPLCAPFQQLSTSLSRAALEAQAESGPLPALDAELTAAQFVKEYLLPLARTDLLYENIFVHSKVASVSRIQWRREHRGEIQDRADDEFRLLIHSKKRGTYSVRADIVLDASGCNVPRPIGPGGGLAIGEVEEQGTTELGLIDWTDAKRAKYSDKHTVLFGDSHFALANIRGFAKLIEAAPGTRVTWVLPLEPACKNTAEQLERLAAASHVGAALARDPSVVAAVNGTIVGMGVLPAVGIERLTRSSRGLGVVVQVNEESTVDIECDELIANTGAAPNWDHAAALTLNQSPRLGRAAFGGSTLVDQLSDDSGGDFEQSIEACIESNILTSEPHYYVLGGKSFGLANQRFKLSYGHRQVRAAFGFIGGRPDLDLYKQFQASNA